MQLQAVFFFFYPVNNHFSDPVGLPFFFHKKTGDIASGQSRKSQYLILLLLLILFGVYRINPGFWKSPFYFLIVALPVICQDKMMCSQIRPIPDFH